MGGITSATVLTLFSCPPCTRPGSACATTSAKNPKACRPAPMPATRPYEEPDDATPPPAPAWRLAALPLVLALGACAFAPDSKPPALAAPTHYGVEALPAAGAPPKAWRSATSKARARCPNGGNAMARTR